MNLYSTEITNKIKLITDDFLNIEIRVIGWEGGHYFKEINEENGGAPDENYKLFDKLPIFHSTKVFSEIMEILTPYINKKALISHNSNYKYIYDIFILYKNCQISYNPFLNKICERKRSWIMRILGSHYTPEWIDYNLVHKIDWD